MFKQETRPGLKDYGRKVAARVRKKSLSLCSMDFTASEIPPNDRMQLLFGTSVYAEKMVVVANLSVTCAPYEWIPYEAILESTILYLT